MLERLVEWLYAEQQDELRSAFTSCLKQVWVRRQAPKEKWQELKQLDDLGEVYTMLQERTGQWPKHWKQEGREEGREEALRSTGRKLIQTTELNDRAIADATGLPLSEVEAMRNEAQH